MNIRTLETTMRGKNLMLANPMVKIAADLSSKNATGGALPALKRC